MTPHYVYFRCIAQHTNTLYSARRTPQEAGIRAMNVKISKFCQELLGALKYKFGKPSVS